MDKNARFVNVDIADENSQKIIKKVKPTFTSLSSTDASQIQQEI